MPRVMSDSAREIGAYAYAALIQEAIRPYPGGIPATHLEFDAVVVIARDASTRQIGRLAWFGRAWPDAVNFFEPPAPGAPPPTTADAMT